MQNVARFDKGAAFIEGAFRQLLPELYTTVGNTSAIPTMQRFAKEMSRDLKAGGVQGVILTGA